MMKEEISQEQCNACGGSIEQSKTTFTVDFGNGVVVVRNVPALICSKCGMEFIDDNNAAEIEEIVEDAKAKQSMVDVMSL